MKENKPKITVVTVCRNAVKDIEQTMLSVLNQTYPDVEYIVIDGASTDGTIDVIKEYSDRLAYFVSEPDKGLYDAMNKGITHATGEWILFRNSGDYFASTSDISFVFENKDNFDADVLYGDAILWDYASYWHEKPERELRNRFGVMMVFHPSTFVRTSIMKECLFDTRYKLAADYDFFMKCEKNEKRFKYVPRVLSIFNLADGASVKGLKQCIEERYYICGGSPSNKVDLFMMRTRKCLGGIHSIIKRLIPLKVMKLRRQAQGRNCWTLEFGIQELVSKALEYRDIEYNF